MARRRLTARDRTAVHEAGHAVAAVILSAGVHWVSLERVGRGDVTVLGRTRWERGAPPLAKAIIAAAGPIAELHTYTGRHRRLAAAERITHGAHRDAAHIDRLAAEFGFDPAEPWRWAGVLIEMHASRIGAVADALARAGKLTGAEVEAVMWPDGSGVGAVAAEVGS